MSAGFLLSRLLLCLSLNCGTVLMANNCLAVRMSRGAEAYWRERDGRKTEGANRVN